MHADLPLVRRALDGEQTAMRQLATMLAPVIQARVARVVLASPRRSVRAVDEEVADLTQDVFVALFANRGRALRAWDPERGASLKNFVGLVAERHAVSLLRSRRQSASTEDMRDPAVLDEPDDGRSEEPGVVSRDLVRKMLVRFDEALSPLGRELFRRIYVEEQTVEDVQRECGLTADAVYQWRSRLRRLARETLSDLEAPLGPGPVESMPSQWESR